MPHISEFDWTHHTHIAFDVDETLADTLAGGLQDFHALGKMLSFPSKETITSFNWMSLDGVDITEEEFLHYWRNHSLRHSLPLHGSIDAVYRLSQRENILHVITARNEHDHGTDTHEWLMKYFPEIHPTRIHFVNHLAKNSLPKSGICKSYNISLLIDDGLHNALDVAEKGIACILIDKPWNQDEFDPSLPIYRAKDWSEIIASLSK